MGLLSPLGLCCSIVQPCGGTWRKGYDKGVHTCAGLGSHEVMLAARISCLPPTPLWQLTLRGPAGAHVGRPGLTELSQADLCVNLPSAEKDFVDTVSYGASDRSATREKGFLTSSCRAWSFG